MSLIGKKGPRSQTCLAVIGLAVGMAVSTTALASSALGQTGGASSPSVLLVGTFHGVKGGYTTIQSAVDAARPGDFILVAPGDYRETADEQSLPASYTEGGFGGVLITTPGITLRGMSRSGVIVDGTKPGYHACSSKAAAQNYGPTAPGGKSPLGRNGIVVYKANNVTIDNLTVCNFLNGAGYAGNEIWWNGGANSDKVGEKGYWGSYLTATSTFYRTESTAAAYGIFSSNAAGPGGWDHIYASNFNDSGMYVGACRQLCDVTISHAWMEYNALGYSGTNSGGTIVVEHSQFDHNKDGFDTNTQIYGDPPAPQNGACLGGKISPITHTHSCWVFEHNYVHNNNNPNVPQAGEASNGPTGTGMTISGGRNDTVMNNVFANNGAWGILFIPYPGGTVYEYHQSCKKTGGIVLPPPFGCTYDPMSDALLHNTFRHNGYFHNPSNSDFGQITLGAHQPQNCFRRNKYPDGSAPSNLEKTQRICGKLTRVARNGGPLFGQVLCDTGYLPCPKGSHYPKFIHVVMHALPKLPSMPNPCAGVPANAWCPGGKPLPPEHRGDRGPERSGSALAQPPAMAQSPAGVQANNSTWRPWLSAARSRRVS